MTKLLLPSSTLCIAAVALVSSGCLNDSDRDGQTQNGGKAASGGAVLASRGGTLNDAGAPPEGGRVGVGGNAPVGGNVGVDGNASVGGRSGMGGSASIGGSVGVGGNLTVAGTISRGGSGLAGGTQALGIAGMAGAAAGRAGMGGAAIAGSGPIGGSKSGVAGSNCRPAPPCPAGWLQYTDTLCPYPVGSPTPLPCSPRGDGLCYPRCTTDADCTDATFPTCGAISMYNGTDFSRPVGVCVSALTVPQCGS